MEPNERAGSAAGTDLLSGGGEMGARIRNFDWSSSALGPIDMWPQSLRSPLSMLLPSKAQIILFWGPEFIVFYNDAYRPVFGAKHPAALGQPGRIAWSEIWDSRLHELLAGVVRTGEAFWASDLPFLLERHGFQEETYFDVSYDPIRAESGRVGGVRCIVTETTPRVLGARRMALLRDLATRDTGARTTREACMLATETLASRPQDVPFALAYLDGELQSCTPGAEEQLRVCRSDLVCDLPVLPSAVDDRHGRLVIGVNPRQPFDVQYRSFVELIAGQLGIAIVNARAYEEARKRAEALAELDRAKTTFFSNISHEFRTPLTLMLGPIEDALTTPNPALPRVALETVHSNALRLLKLVNTLLDFSRIEAGRIEACYRPTDLAALTIELASNFRSAIEKAGLSFRIDCAPLSQDVYVDRDMWEKIVLNLLSNAFKFTFDGEISLTLRAQQDGSTVELVVHDTGVGIPRDELPRVFERFHRVQGTRARTHEGTGIGLALVNELVKLHGGIIEVDSEEGRGTAFTIRVPIGAAHLPADRVNAEPALASTASRNQVFIDEALLWLSNDETTSPARLAVRTSGHVEMNAGSLRWRGRVLLVDDNADMRRYVQGLLREQGYEVACATNGRDALDMALTEPPDLVLTDVMMPDLDGFGLLHELRSRGRTRAVPIVMISARAGEEARVEGLDRGADDYVIKPFTARELLARVGAHLSLSRERKEVAESLRKGAEAARAKLAELSHQLIEMHERERSWIARELHDDIGQPVVALTLQLHGLTQGSIGCSEALRAGVADVCRQLSALIGDIQAISQRLHSPTLDLLGLSSAAASLCRDLARQHAMTIEMHDEGVPHQLPRSIAIGLFRVLQEALTNAIKHSGVRHLTVTLHGTGDDIHMDVTDEGIGFDPERAINGPGLGLVSMRERLTLLGGELCLESRPGAGARIRARVPLRDQAQTP